MAAKKIDPMKAKEAKQKKIAIGGAVLLIALLAFQGPKTLKMLQGPQAVPAPAAAAPSTTPAAASGSAVAPPLAAAPELSALADSDLSPVAEQGQLATFERFASKDPFAQQAQPVEQPARVAGPNDGTKPTASGTATAPAPPEKASTDSDDDATAGGFTTGNSAPESPATAAATSVSVNGVAEDVAVEGSFPKDEPTFVLVKLADNGKSVEIGIAGGEYADGDETITLKLGQKLTLQNTADGSRFELELLTIQGQPVPKSRK